MKIEWQSDFTTIDPASTVAVIVATKLSKCYAQGNVNICAVDDVDLIVRQGEFVSILGPRGSGKSTLLYLLGGLERPTAGRLRIADVDLCSLSDNELAKFRRRKIGFVFQFFNLLPALTVAENVALPLMLEGVRYASLRDRVDPIIDMLSLSDRAGCMPSELFADEMQRAAIARALVMDPDLILADEPTAQLDRRSGAALLAHFSRIRKEHAVTIVLVTHDLSIASCADRAVILRDGHIESDAPIRSFRRQG